MPEIISTGSFILLICSVVTGLVVEAIKKMVGDTPVRNINILVAIISVIVGTVVPIGYMIVHKIPITSESILFIIGIVGLSWLCSMVGYDKVVQTILQTRSNESK